MNRENPILGFKSEYSFLSNFQDFETPLFYDGILYTSNEHFYQAMKTEDKNIRLLISQHPKKGLKKYIRQLQLLPSSTFANNRISIMRFGIKHKFNSRNPYLRKKLLETGDRYIEETNNWGDKFWGVCAKTGEGHNHLGKLLMERRELCRAFQSIDK